MQSQSNSNRVQKYRNTLRAAGMRPIQIWVPDTRAAGFLVECKRQSLLAVSSDMQDSELNAFLDVALSETEGWEL